MLVATFLELQDLTIAGVGFELGGGALLGLGLLAGHAELTRRAGIFSGSNAYQAVSAARDRIDAISGLVGLCVGFALQAVAYAADLLTPLDARRGLSEAAAGIAAGVLGLVLVAASAWLHRRLRLTPTLVEMARYEVDGRRREHPQARLLPAWLEAAGHARQDGEDDLSFARRVAGVGNLSGPAASNVQRSLR